MKRKRYKIAIDGYIMVTMELEQACDTAMAYICLPIETRAIVELRNRFEQKLTRLERGESFTYFNIVATVF